MQCLIASVVIFTSSYCDRSWKSMKGMACFKIWSDQNFTCIYKQWLTFVVPKYFQIYRNGSLQSPGILCGCMCCIIIKGIFHTLWVVCFAQRRGYHNEIVAHWCGSILGIPLIMQRGVCIYIFSNKHPLKTNTNILSSTTYHNQHFFVKDNLHFINFDVKMTSPDENMFSCFVLSFIYLLINSFSMNSVD